MEFFKLKSLLQGKKARHTPMARLLHWFYAPAVLIGAWSGFYITRPSSGRGFKNMDSARKTHFIAKYILLFSYLSRVYYGYASKNAGQLVPGPKNLARLPAFSKFELFFTKKKPKFPKYNPGQKIIFSNFAVLIPLQIVTGLALYFTGSFQKPARLVGGLNPLRKIHYLAAVAISSLAAGHIYFALTSSLKKLKSIFTGYE